MCHIILFVQKGRHESVTSFRIVCPIQVRYRGLTINRAANQIPEI